MSNTNNYYINALHLRNLENFEVLNLLQVLSGDENRENKIIIHLLIADAYHFAEMFSNRKPLWCRSSFSFSIVILFDPCCCVFPESIPLMLKEGKWISVKLSSSQRKKWGIVSCIKVSILSFGSEQKQYICFPHKTHMWTYWNSFWLFFAQQCAPNEKSFGAFHNR